MVQLCLFELIFIVSFFDATATTEIYTYLHTLSLHDALPISRALVSGFECSASVDYVSRYPATINDPACARIVREVASSVSGIQVVDAPPSMAAEDFAFMLRETAGCYFWLGAKREGTNPGLHSSYFRSEEQTSELQSLMRISYA